MPKNKRVVITGVNSFTGKYLKGELEAHDWSVWGIGLNIPTDSAYNKPIDLNDSVALSAFIGEVQPHAVVHLAGVSFVAEDNVDHIYNVNLLGTRTLLDSIQRSGAKPELIVLASSAQVYGNSHVGTVSERADKAPSNDYGVSKLAMEYMAATWKEKLPITITRPFNYTGRGQAGHFLIPKIVRHYKERLPVLELGNLDVWRDFSDVRYVSGIYRSLLEAREAGLTVNVCSGVTHSLREILAMCEKITGFSPEIRVNPAFVRQNEVRTLSGDTTRLKSVIGDYPPIALEDTLRWMLES